MKNGKDYLNHPTTLKLFIYCKQKDEVGIREAQKHLGVKSPSTVSWHFEKLLNNGVVVRLNNSKYQLTEKGIGIDELTIPVSLPLRLINGKYMPDTYLLLSFILSSIILLVGMIFINQTLSLIFAILTLASVFVLLYRNYKIIKTQINKFGLNLN